MPGPMLNSPADVIRALMVELGLGAEPVYVGDVQTATWPIFRWNEPDRPDDVITLYDTTGTIGAMSHPDGEVNELHGFQVRVRSANGETGYAKARAIAIAFDAVEYESVNAGTGTGTGYIVKSLVRRSDVRRLGADTPMGRRQVYVVDYLASIRMCD